MLHNYCALAGDFLNSSINADLPLPTGQVGLWGIGRDVYPISTTNRCCQNMGESIEKRQGRRIRHNDKMVNCTMTSGLIGMDVVGMGTVGLCFKATTWMKTLLVTDHE